MPAFVSDNSRAGSPLSRCSSTGSLVHQPIALTVRTPSNQSAESGAGRSRPPTRSDVPSPPPQPMIVDRPSTPPPSDHMPSSAIPFQGDLSSALSNIHHGLGLGMSNLSFLPPPSSAAVPSNPYPAHHQAPPSSRCSPPSPPYTSAAAQDWLLYRAGAAAAFMNPLLQAAVAVAAASGKNGGKSSGAGAGAGSPNGNGFPGNNNGGTPYFLPSAWSRSPSGAPYTSISAHGVGLNLSNRNPDHTYQPGYATNGDGPTKTELNGAANGPPSPAVNNSAQAAAAAAMTAAALGYPVANRLPPDIPRDPKQWSREEVHRWLLWCQDEFDLPSIDIVQFPMNGKALCLLLKSDFHERAPRAGDILYNTVHLLLLEASAADDSPASRYERHLRLYGYAASPLLSSEGPPSGSWPPSSGGGGGGGWPGLLADYQGISMAHLANHLHQTAALRVTASPAPLQLDLTTNGNGSHHHHHHHNGVGESTVTLSPAPSTDESHSSDGSPGRMRDDRSDDGSSPTNLTVSKYRRSDDIVLIHHHPHHHHHHHTKQRDDVTMDGAHPTDISGDSEVDSPPPPLLSPKTVAATPPTTDMMMAELLHSGEQPVTNGRLLWDFLHQLLNDPAQRYVRCIAWKEKDAGVFKITDPHGLAQLWGMQKNHLNMNFDKMSRALRYYYRVNILRKVQGERHCYQFLRQPMELKACKQRALLNKYCPIPPAVKHSASMDPPNSLPVAIKCEQRAA